MVERISTGVVGLDSLLDGGLFSERAYMVSGGPGTGKTTLCFHFLTANGQEPSLMITLDKNVEKLQWMAESLGLYSDSLILEDLSPGDIRDETRNSFDVMPSSELGLGPLVDKICQAVERHTPSRVAIEPLSTLWALAPDSYQFRRQCQALFNFLTERGATVMFSTEDTSAFQGHVPVADLYFVADGIVSLERVKAGRMVSVTKFRGSGFTGGRQFMRLTGSGMEVFPQLMPRDRHRPGDRGQVQSGIAELDNMLKGGLDTATLTIISGPSGAGKTTLAMQFVTALAKQGEQALVCAFEESGESILLRCRALGLPVDDLIRDKSLEVRSIDPMRYAPDELAQALRREVEENGVRVVMIDGSAGYKVSVANLAVAGEDVSQRLHILCRYLVGAGVTVLLVNETPTIASDTLATADPNITYFSDILISLRYIEIDSELQKTISIIKRRAGDFDNTLRRLEITDQGLKVGQPLREMQGILRGQPVQDGCDAPMEEPRDGSAP